MFGSYIYETKFKSFLIEQGYEEDKILTEWGNFSRKLDIVILSNDYITPIAAFEIKCGKSLNKISRQAICQLNDTARGYNLDIPLYLAYYDTETEELTLYDARKSYEEIKNDKSVQGEGKNEINLPTYKELVNKDKSVKKNNAQAKKEKYLDIFKIICWLIIPVIGVGLVILDLFEILPLTTERLIVLGVLLIIIMLPFFNEISIKDISLRRNNKGEN